MPGIALWVPRAERVERTSKADLQVTACGVVAIFPPLLLSRRPLAWAPWMRMTGLSLVIAASSLIAALEVTFQALWEAAPASPRLR